MQDIANEAHRVFYRITRPYPTNIVQLVNATKSICDDDVATNRIVHYWMKNKIVSFSASGRDIEIQEPHNVWAQVSNEVGKRNRDIRMKRKKMTKGITDLKSYAASVLGELENTSPDQPAAQYHIAFDDDDIAIPSSTILIESPTD